MINTSILRMQNTETHLYNDIGAHIHTIPIKILKWLYKKLQRKPIHLDPSLQNFEIDVLAIYTKYKMLTHHKESNIHTQHHIDTTILQCLIDNFEIQHSYFSSPITCPTTIHSYNSPHLRDNFWYKKTCI